jgi:hypothetical protein
MLFRAFGFLSKISSKFAYEVAPVALASVIGTIAVNHYSHPAAAPVVVQAPLPASEDAVLRSLHEEHELIADFLKHRQAAEAKSAALAERAALAATAPLPPEGRPNKPAAHIADKAAARAAPKPAPAPEKKLAASDPLSLTPDFSTLPPAAAAPTPEPGFSLRPGARALHVAGAMRDLVVDVASFPARTLAPRALDGAPTPPVRMPATEPDPAQPD